MQNLASAALKVGGTYAYRLAIAFGAEPLGSYRPVQERREAIRPILVAADR